MTHTSHTPDLHSRSASPKGKRRKRSILCLFNPDTDLALANNQAHYMPPASARQMAQDLAVLPIWYAPPGSAVLAPSAYNAEFLKNMQALFPLSVTLVTEPELHDYLDAAVLPWGWNLALRKRLMKVGIPRGNLPDLSELQILRIYSSRDWAVKVLDEFKGMEHCCGEAFLLGSLDDCRAFVESLPHTVLKAPWSGSGKGLNWCRGVFTDSVEGWCRHVLNEQGSLVGQPVYNKVEDFALEFYITPQGKANFIGYSLFTTNEKGAYQGNRLLADGELECWLASYLPAAVLKQVRLKMQALLAAMFGDDYTGFLGVDMMVCRDAAGGYLIHPCVEINLRMNMGVAAHLFRKNFVAPEARGFFKIDFYPTPEALQAAHKQAVEKYPLQVEEGRLLSGYLPLTPVTPQSCYLAYALCPAAE